MIKDAEVAARSLGVRLRTLVLRDAREFDGARNNWALGRWRFDLAVNDELVATWTFQIVGSRDTAPRR